MDLAKTYEVAIANVDLQVQSDLKELDFLYSKWRRLRALSRSTEASSIKITQEIAAVRERLVSARAKREASLISRLGPFDDAPGDDIHINCGGKHFIVQREILCRDKASSLAALCRKGGPPAAGGPGSSKEQPIYLDRDWVTFEQVLSFLSKGPAGLPPSSDASSLRSLYIESAFFMLTSLRDSIEDVLISIEEEESLKVFDEDLIKRTEDEPDIINNQDINQDALNTTQSSSSSSAFLSDTAAFPSTPKRVSQQDKEYAPLTPKADVLIAAATAITRSRDVINSAIEGVIPDEDLALLNASLRSPLRNTTSSSSQSITQQGITHQNRQTPQRNTISSLNTSLSAVDAPFSPAAAAMRRTLNEMELDMLREPTQPTSEETLKAAAAAAKAKKPIIMTTADYIGGTWKTLYDQPTKSTTTNITNSSSKLGSSTTTTTTTSESLESKAAATALPDPFGFARRF